MYIQYLIEDISGKKLIDAIMNKYLNEKPGADITYSTVTYKGIGGFPKGKDARYIKSQQLLNDLPKRLRAFESAFKHRENVALFVILDNDKRDTMQFREQLNKIIQREAITIDHVVCIAVEEMEAWLLGDCDAIKAAYPKLADRIATKHPNYQQDSICNTWEFLAEMLTQRGFGQFIKQNPSPFDIGKCKSEWAENIGKHINIRANASPSFQYLLSELDLRNKAS